MARDSTALNQIRELLTGESIVYSEVLQRASWTPESIANTKTLMRGTVSKTLSRLRDEEPTRRYTTESYHLITDRLQAIILVVITRIENDLTQAPPPSTFT
jgi:hypothetical protein